MKTYQIDLSEGKATIEVPGKLNGGDGEVLIKWLECIIVNIITARGAE